ncbi:hypothetical protein I7I48_00089 [Histoplasma ohiense]|nr:hypothetical protein I7I48_00089 [Histoplasma ohiense (nom. inval.)]
MYMYMYMYMYVCTVHLLRTNMLHILKFAVNSRGKKWQQRWRQCHPTWNTCMMHIIAFNILISVHFASLGDIWTLDSFPHMKILSGPIGDIYLQIYSYIKL